MTVNIETRNDFTIGELEDAIHEGQSVETTYVPNPDYDEQLRAHQEHRTKVYAAHKGDYTRIHEEMKNGPQYPYRYLTDPNGGFLVESVEIVDEPVGEDFYNEPDTIPGIGHFEQVTGGNLGDGQPMWSVIRHKESGRTFIKWGYYSSWDASDFDGELVEVEPVQVTVTRYKNVKDGTVYTDPTL